MNTIYRSNAYQSNSNKRYRFYLTLGIIIIVAALICLYAYTRKPEPVPCKENVELLTKGQSSLCFPGKTMHVQETYEGLIAWCTCPGQNDIDIRNIRGVSLPLKEE